MNLREFNQTPSQRINKINQMLNEQYGVSVKTKILSKKKLQRIAENANMQVIRLRNTNKQFHLDPDYAKFLGIRDVIETMIAEGQYAESPKYIQMKREINETVRELMDSGYTQEEACSEAMNRFRRDSRFAYDDDHVKPIVLQAARRYAAEYGSDTSASANLNEPVLAELASRAGIRLENVASCNTVEETIQGYAEACGKSAAAITEWLNQQTEATLSDAIDMLESRVKQSRQTANAQDINTMESKRISKNLSESKNLEQRAERAFQELKQIGAPVNHFGQGWGGRALFSISGEQNYDETWADYYDEFDIGEFGVNSKIVAVLDKHGLYAEWQNPGVLDVYSALNESRKISEGVDIEQAEVVIAARSLASDIQDQVERLGRMVNEEIPAIVEQMVSEMGAQTAQAFNTQALEVLNGHLEAARAAKASMDAAIATITGAETIDSPGLNDLDSDDADLDLDLDLDLDSDDDLGLDDAGSDELDTLDDLDNIDADAGTPGEPLGRAGI
jgi:hypothetical protein